MKTRKINTKEKSKNTKEKQGGTTGNQWEHIEKIIRKLWERERNTLRTEKKTTTD